MAILPKTYRRDCLLDALALVEKFMSHGQADVPDYIPCWTTAFCAFASARPARRYGRISV